ncbi:hypothetical protein, partial [Staphylococcus aureus]|uniref:hypothetical protein n=1 Tax=Staphylococcus aureus TaxID=1280 RepID=UPI001F59E7CB
IGGSPTQKLAKIQLTIMCELAGLQHREIGTAISTDNASWRGPNTEASEKSAYNNVQVGGGPNTEAGEKSAYNNVQVGAGQK